MAALVPSVTAAAVPAATPEAETETDTNGRRNGIGRDYGRRCHDGGWRHSDGGRRDRHIHTDTDTDARLGFRGAEHQSRGCQRQRTDTQRSREPIHLEHHGLSPRMRDFYLSWQMRPMTGGGH
jgi:hypothetical protein